MRRFYSWLILSVALLLLCSCSKGAESTAADVDYIDIVYYVNASDDMLDMAEIEASYTDPANGEIVAMTIDEPRWQRNIRIDSDDFPSTLTVKCSFELRSDVDLASERTFMVVGELNATAVFENGDRREPFSQKFYFSEVGVTDIEEYFASLGDSYLTVSIDKDGSFKRR